MVVDKQHAQASKILAHRADRLRRFGIAFEADAEGEGTALIDPADHVDIAAHGFRQFLADGEPEAGSAITSGRRLVSLAERAEQAFALLGRNADAAVGNAELQFEVGALPAGADCGNLDLPYFGKFDRVVH